jgi:molybdopterin-containing oxidoreductase family iron-sulfur binding subunit
MFFHGANPVFTLPEETGFRAALAKVPLVVSFSSYLDETAAEADLILPDHHPLESWGDYTPCEGVYGLMQPVMQPLYQTQAIGDTLLSIARKVDGQTAGRFPWPGYYDYLRASWRNLQKQIAAGAPFDEFWKKALSQGVVWKEAETESVRLSEAVYQASFPKAHYEGDRESSFNLHLYPSISHFDGRSANRPWLQELPDPMTKIVWDNWLEIHPETARRLGIAEGDVVKLGSPYGVIEIPAHLYEWLRPDVVAIPLGQGHTAFGRYAGNQGVNPMALLPSQPEPVSGSPVFLSVKVQISRTARRHPLVSTAGSDRQEGRGIAQAVGLSELVRVSGQEEKDDEHKAQMYPPHPHPEHRWGMAVDLNACIGCSACIVACDAENNVPVVGRERMAQGREMSWIRIERYFEVENEKPDTRFVPMLCQQCHSAPCEPVCPVKATYHNDEGLNAQVYNRCVGTRYCSNNCPYKVRRFNWFEYEWPDPLHLQLNPDVSVRSKGIMEKCTFCVQRIREVKDRAKDHGSAIQDGEIVPACVQTCPTQALVFGDLKDPNSKVSELAADPRRYHVLEHLNTQPAVTYLKKIKRDSV